MSHYCKSPIDEDELAGDVAFFLRMNRHSLWNQNLRNGLTDFLHFTYGDDLIVAFPEFGKLTLTRPRKRKQDKVWTVTFDIVAMEARLVA